MRTFIFLLCTTVFGFTSNNLLSQVSNIRINEDKTLSVDEIFELISDQTDYRFIYQSDIFEGLPKVELRKGTIPANELLQSSIDIKAYNFNLINNTINVSKKTPSELGIQQDTYMVSGFVKDEVGQPLVGATVYVSSYNPKDGDNPSDFLIRGTQTDFDGRFTLEVSLNQYIAASFVGFERYSEQLVNRTKTEYNIVLKEYQNKLDEVVLTGITKVEKTRSSAAASKITKDKITRQITTDLDDRLEGLSPGLVLNKVTSDGGQQTVELVLRGVSTFDEPGRDDDPVFGELNRLNRQPLIILDGFPYEGPFNDIDPETIESIDVLRDAAATAIWGVRASNGVLVITTKRGRIGKARVSYKSNVTLGTTQDLDQLAFASSAATIDVLNAIQELEPTFNSAFFAISNGPSNPFGALFRRYVPLNAFDEIWAQFYAGGITEATRDGLLAGLSQQNVLSQFKDQFIRGGSILQNSLNINGGGQSARYNFTASHTQEDLPTIGDNFERLNLALTTDIAISDKLKTVLDVSFVNSVSELNGIHVSNLYTGSFDSENPVINIFDRLVDDNGNALPILDVYSGYRDDFLASGFDDPSYSPVLNWRLRDNKTTSMNLRLAGGLNYKIFDWLIADLKYQYNRVSQLTENVRPVDQYFTRRRNNTFITGLDTGNGVTRAVPYGGTLERNEQITVNNVFRGTLNFDKTFGGNHYVSALAGIEVSENSITTNRQEFFGYNDITGLYDTNFSPSSFGNLGIIPGSFLNGRLSNRDLFTPEIISRVISSFANVGYSYKNRYNLEASGKIDQSSTFGLGKRLSKPLLWAVGAGWNIHNEEFFKSSWVDNLKLRLSYGKNGNLRRGLTAVTTIQYGLDSGGIFGVGTGPDAQIATPGNPNITFEETTTKNIGLDFSLFNRVQGSIDVYDKSSANLLGLRNINTTLGQAGIVGESVIYANNGEISNKGFEIALAADIVRTAEFNWNANLNFSHNQNEVVSFGFTPVSGARNYIIDVENSRTQIVGQPVSARARFRWAGLDSDGNPQIFDDNNQPVGYLSDGDDYPSIEGLDVTKPFIAPTFGGLTNTLTYKNFTFSFLMTFKAGHVFEEDLRSKYAYGRGVPFHKDIANAWQNPGDENITDIPAIPRTAGTFSSPGENSFERQNIFVNSNLGIQDASHIRLQDVTLNYSFDEISEKVGFEDINLTFQARNLGLLWTANDKDIDPESVPFSGEANSTGSGFDSSFRPGIRIPVSFVLGVQLIF